MIVLYITESELSDGSHSVTRSEETFLLCVGTIRLAGNTDVYLNKFLNRLKKKFIL